MKNFFDFEKLAVKSKGKDVSSKGIPQVRKNNYVVCVANPIQTDSWRN